MPSLPRGLSTLTDCPHWAAGARCRRLVRHRGPTDPERGEHPVSAGLRRREDLGAIEAIGVVTAMAKRIMDGNLPRRVSERQARRLLLERKLAAFDLIAERDIGQPARDARAQAAEVFEQLVAWHRQDLDARLTVDAAANASSEGYRFALDSPELRRDASCGVQATDALVCVPFPAASAPA